MTILAASITPSRVLALSDCEIRDARTGAMRSTCCSKFYPLPAQRMLLGGAGDLGFIASALSAVVCMQRDFDGVLPHMRALLAETLKAYRAAVDPNPWPTQLVFLAGWSAGEQRMLSREFAAENGARHFAEYNPRHLFAVPWPHSAHALSDTASLAGLLALTRLQRAALVEEGEQYARGTRLTVCEMTRDGFTIHTEEQEHEDITQTNPDQQDHQRDRSAQHL